MSKTAPTGVPAAAAAFDGGAARYDALRRTLVPGFDAFYGNVAEVIADWRPGQEGAGLRAIDLGAGTGLMAATVRRVLPRARLHLVDASAPMLALARERFAGDAAVSYGLLDLAGDAIAPPDDPPGCDLGGWDLVVSALAIHHLSDAEKQALFARILAALVPGGLFVNAEQVAGPETVSDDRYRRLWEQQVRAAGATATEVTEALARMRHDRCASVADQLGWLRAAGFVDVDCTFKAWRFAVLVARKPG